MRLDLQETWHIRYQSSGLLVLPGVTTLKYIVAIFVANFTGLSFGDYGITLWKLNIAVKKRSLTNDLRIKTFICSGFLTTTGQIPTGQKRTPTLIQGFFTIHQQHDPPTRRLTVVQKEEIELSREVPLIEKKKHRLSHPNTKNPWKPFTLHTISVRLLAIVL